MTESIYLLFTAAAAWFTALLFIRDKLVTAAVHALTAGAVCGAAYFMLRRIGGEKWLIPVLALLFLVSASAVLLREKDHKGNALIALALACAAFSALMIPLKSYRGVGMAAIWMGSVMIACLAAVTLTVRRRFPERDWRSAYSAGDKKRADLTRLLMYTVPSFLSAVLAGTALVFKADSAMNCFAASVLAGALFGFGLWLMFLIPAYRRERSAVMEEKQYREDMQSFLNVIRSQRHDYNFHVQTISGLIRQGKVDECLNYVNALEEDSAVMNAVLPVKDPAISAMIHNFRMIAVREGIVLNVDIRYDLSQIATNVYETNKIISNLLQNAIDEVSTHEDKSYGINLSIIKRGEYCVIRVSNKLNLIPDAGQLGEVFRQGYTTKKGHDGVGLSSVKTLLSRYHGTIYTQLEDDVIHFIARVPINYAKEVIV